jgi:hypothetical protein
MPHQISLKITTGDTVFFLRDNKIQSGVARKIIIHLIHVPPAWDNLGSECVVTTDVYISIDPIHLKNSKSIPDSGFSRPISQVFLTKDELIQDLVK